MAFALNSNFDHTNQNAGVGQTEGARRPSFSSAKEQLEKQFSNSYKPTDSSLPTTNEKGDSSSSSDENGDAEVKKLARQYSNTSVLDNPFEAAPDSSIDPSSDNFRARDWTKAMLKLQAQTERTAKSRSAGFAFKNLNAYGQSASTDYQKTVGNYALDLVGLAKRAIGHSPQRLDILRDFEGVVQPGEMLVVLGPPGSGCTTFLRTLAGEVHGYKLSDDTYFNYQGISYKHMHKHFRGEVIYTAEQDVHFPSMTVGDTLLFAAQARAPRYTPGGVSKLEYATHVRDVIMATFGIRHTINTKVGNDFIRGVSGGERKRVTIAEAALSGAPVQCWDNSTRGLDSANAIEFCKTLRTSTDLQDATVAVSIYQAPQSAYNYFDKAIVIYEGRQIFFGRATEARKYFEELGFECPERQTTADFMTSMTSAAERKAKPGWENKVPRTPDEFAQRWKESENRKALMVEIEQFEAQHPIGGADLKTFKESRRQQQAKIQRVESPYTLSYLGQVKLCLWRGFRRLSADPSLTITQLFANAINALIVGSLFYNQQKTTDSFRARSALLFFAVLLNAFASALELLMLYAQRPIVEKHSRYAFYHPSAEAFASMLTDLPSKILSAVGFNLVLYFMTNLRREPGPFFFFFFVSFLITMVMSMLFRTIASVSRSLVQALVPTAVLILAIVIYTGFTIPISYMLGWARWINYINPVSYGFESLMINEFHNRQFNCSTFVPPFGESTRENQICGSVGAVAGQDFVDGDTYIETSFNYMHANKWRNVGILFGFLFFLLFTYLVSAELVEEKKSKGEVLLFRRGYKPASLKAKQPGDVESGANSKVELEKGVNKQDVSDVIQKQTAIFQWKDVCFDIKIKKEERRILDHVDGFIRPGTMTALMGVSGAGKTTLLDVLAQRVTIGVISGDMLVDGRPRDESFQRKTGYVQQQDLHLDTTTVREALQFSALLRQPAKTPRQEKLDYCDEVIKLLEMEEYADAIVGVPGEGLNVEQRKRLTIGVELAAKPALLLFLDEPTSGLDSQTSWSILDLLEKLTNNGQAILCTIHQPSAILFQRFDRLLFLAAGGKTVYFGPVGENSNILSSYFERNGASPCPSDANPAEWMLEVIGAAPGTSTDIDWHQVWRNSPEIKAVHEELETLKTERPKITQPSSDPDDKTDYREFAAPFLTQWMITQKRIFEQYWRTPSYIFSKISLVAASGLFIGFSFFNAPNTQQGLQNQLFGIFMLLTLFSQLVQQIMPLFVSQRSLYEARERPSKTYSWKAFLLSNMLVEIPWSTLAAAVLFFTWYYPIRLYQNAQPTDAVNERGAVVFLFIWAFLLFSSTFAHMAIAGIDTAETAGNVANLMFTLCLLFCGVLVPLQQMPGFWTFMYRVSPFTYLVSGVLSGGVAGTDLICAENEYLRFSAPNGTDCNTYLSTAGFLEQSGGFLLDGSSSDCQFCPASNTDQFLAQVNIYYSNAWRDFGLMFCYIGFNVVGALVIYWLARVPKDAKKRQKKQKQT